MKKLMIYSPSGYLAAALGLCLLASAGAADAETRRQGFYAGFEVGYANAGDVGSVNSAVNHPTPCDILVGGDPTGPGCADMVARPLSTNSFDLGARFSGGISYGYALNEFRVELEYFSRSQGGVASPWELPGGNEALQSKTSEVSALEPPSERISDFYSRQFFLNAYYDFLSDSRWTPYLGGGVGWARTDLNYRASFLRRTIDQGYPSDRPPAAAGTLSLLESDFSDTLFGYQLLGGLDYALSEKVSLGIKGRWASFDDLEGDTVWDLIRSHAPVRADGVTPFDSALTFSNLQYWALTAGLKYAF